MLQIIHAHCLEYSYSNELKIIDNLSLKLENEKTTTFKDFFFLP